MSRPIICDSEGSVKAIRRQKARAPSSDEMSYMIRYRMSYMMTMICEIKMMNDNPSWQLEVLKSFRGVL